MVLYGILGTHTSGIEWHSWGTHIIPVVLYGILGWGTHTPVVLYGILGWGTHIIPVILYGIKLMVSHGIPVVLYGPVSVHECNSWYSWRSNIICGILWYQPYGTSQYIPEVFYDIIWCNFGIHGIHFV